MAITSFESHTVRAAYAQVNPHWWQRLLDPVATLLVFLPPGSSTRNNVGSQARLTRACRRLP